MISTSGGSYSTPASAGSSRLCHVCGIAYPKASLPSHQRSCIRKSFGVHPLTRQMATLSAGNAPTYPCGHCMERIPQHKMTAHLRTCQGSSSRHRNSETKFNSGMRPGGFSANASASLASSHLHSKKSVNDQTSQSLAKSYDYDFPEETKSTHVLSHSAPIRRGQYSTDEQRHHNSSWHSQSSGFWEERTAYDGRNDSSNTYEDFMAELDKDGAAGNMSQRAGSARVLPRRSVKETRPNTFSVIDAGKIEPPIQKNGHAPRNSGSASTNSSIDKYTYNFGDDGDELSAYKSISAQAAPSRTSSKSYQFTENKYEVSEFPVINSLSAVEVEGEIASEPVVLIPCDICQRKFKEDRLEKHRTACLKAQKARKVFDASSARVKGTEMEKFVSKAGNERAAKKEAEIEKQLKAKKSHWRAKHEAFVEMVRSARNPGEKSSRGSKAGSGTVSKTTVFDPNPDYITCPTCNRRFNQDSGERHITFCKEKQQQSMLRSRQSLASGGSGGANKEMLLKRRTAYKPPPPKISTKK